MGELMRVTAEEVHLRTSYILKGWLNIDIPSLTSPFNMAVMIEMLERGFTTVRDTGGATKVLANAIEEGLITGPRLFQCGKALSQTGTNSGFPLTLLAYLTPCRGAW